MSSTKSVMTYDELRRALIGQYAHDMDLADAALRDEELLVRCAATLKAMNQGSGRVRQPTDAEIFLSRLVREHFLSDRALRDGYTLGDAMRFAQWLNDSLGMDL